MDAKLVAMALESTSIERCLEILAREIRSDAALAIEFEGSIETFFRGPAPGAGSNAKETLLAARRHLEWFLVEHHSPSLRGSVAERLEERYSARLEELRRTEEDALVDELVVALDALRRSHTGIFDVEEIRGGEGAWLRDLTGFGSHALMGGDFCRRLSEHDLLVGRLYPAGDGLNAASPAVAIVRGANVAGALEADLDRMRREGAAKVMRVSQGELEAMFFGAGTGTSLLARSDPGGGSGAAQSEVVEKTARSKNPVEAAVAIMREAGLDEENAEAAVAGLRREPRRPDRLVHGGSDALGLILEELAFDTDVDLDAARSALVRAWDIVTAAAKPSATERKGATGGAGDEDEDVARKRAVDAFAQGCAGGGDAGELVETLRRDLGLDDDDDDEDMPAPDFPGVVGAMIEEMSWELAASDPAFDAASLEPLKHLANFAKPIGVFEELKGNDLFRFATFWLQEKGALQSDEEAVRLVHALRSFCEWALDAHEVDLGSEFMDALDGLESSLPRMRHANAVLGASVPDADADVASELYEIVTLDEGNPTSFEESNDRLRPQSGEAMSVVLDAELRPHLRPGDHVRGRVAIDGSATVFRCYPPEAAALTAG